jgi:hypothetical protein
MRRILCASSGNNDGWTYCNEMVQTYDVLGEIDALLTELEAEARTHKADMVALAI